MAAEAANNAAAVDGSATLGAPVIVAIAVVVVVVIAGMIAGIVYAVWRKRNPSNSVDARALKYKDFPEGRGAANSLQSKIRDRDQKVFSLLLVVF